MSGRSKGSRHLPHLLLWGSRLRGMTLPEKVYGTSNVRLHRSWIRERGASADMQITNVMSHYPHPHWPHRTAEAPS